MEPELTSQTYSCGLDSCPRHQRAQFNPVARCAAPPPAHWPPLEQRAWYKRSVNTPRSTYGIMGVPDSYNKRPKP